MPRKGQALLQGIVRCGRCGARMRLHYSGTNSQFPVYICCYARTQYGTAPCQQVRGLGLDAEVEKILLAALAPDRINMALAALEQLEQEYDTLRQQWQHRLERARYEVERAQRQYNLVDPENRLVARTLEQQWEERLRTVEQVEQDYQSWLQHHRLQLTDTDREDILCLGADLPKLWQAQTTTPADRKQILRLLIKEVLVDQHRARGKVWFQINWQTGATSEHWFIRRVHSYSAYADLEALKQRMRALLSEQKMDDQIAESLNAEGFRTARGYRFSSHMVWLLRKRWGLPATHAQGPYPLQWDDGAYSVEGAALTLGVYPGTIYKWLRGGRLQGHQLTKGAPWKISLTQEQIASLQDHLKRTRRSKKEA